ncbi:MAG TPA: ankyrin repeat domain-containing protein, partial [Candidatus Wallbacteria bacterium]|nr:ankyrin repeat domain-containing protein [Candidatus Wallbacteria bacterium]
DDLNININNMNKKVIKSNNLDLIKIYVKSIETYNSNRMINGVITEALTQRCELSILKYLLDSVESINESVISEAVDENNIEALKLLLSAENIKKIAYRSELFNITLMNAIGRKNIEMVKILSGVISEDEMDSDCSINRFNNRSFSSFPLVMSIIDGNDEIAGILLEKKNNVNKRYRYDFTALAYASWYGRDELIKILLSKGANPDLGTSDGTTPLMYASMAGNTGAIELLIKNGANVNAKNNNGINALCEAITSARTEAAELLKAKGADLKEAEKILEKIKRAGTNINSKDSRGNTMLRKAAYEKDYLKAKLLIDRGARIKESSLKGDNILKAAIIYDEYWRYGTFPYELFKLLVDKGADPYCENNEKAFADMLSASIISKYDNMIDLLKNKPDSIDISKMSNLIEAAISTGSIVWLSQLIDKGVGINYSITPENQYYQIPLFFTAVDKCDYQILELMLKKGVDVNARAIKNNGGNRSLTTKISDSIHYENSGTIIGKSFYYLYNFKEYGGNAFFFINKRNDDTSKIGNCFKILEMLIKSGCDINARNDYGYTPIFANSIHMDSPFIKSMIALGADVNVRGTDELKLTPIFAACLNKWDPEVLNVLIDNGAEVNQVAQDMWTPLMFAVRAKNARAVEILVKRSAKINEANADGMTALDMFYSYSYRPDDANKKIQKILRSAGATSGHKKYECETVFN